MEQRGPAWRLDGASPTRLSEPGVRHPSHSSLSLFSSFPIFSVLKVVPPGHAGCLILIWNLFLHSTSYASHTRLTSRQTSVPHLDTSNSLIMNVKKAETSQSDETREVGDTAYFISYLYLQRKRSFGQMGSRHARSRIAASQQPLPSLSTVSS